MTIVHDLDFLQGVQVPAHISPPRLQAANGLPSLKLAQQHEREETHEHVAADCGVPVVEDRTGLQQALGVSKDPFDLTQVLVAKSHWSGRWVQTGP